MLGRDGDYYEAGAFDSIEDANGALARYEAIGGRGYVDTRDGDLEREVTRAVKALDNPKCRQIRWAGVAP